MFDFLFTFIRDHYQTNDFIPLHIPRFFGNERQYVLDTIDTGIVSSVGSYVDAFEKQIALFTNSPYAIAAVNGTAALHTALILAHVSPGDYVITQSLTFIATCNAITYCGATPLFIDIDKTTLGLSAEALQTFLEAKTFIDADGLCRLKEDNRIIRVCLPMHTFGHPVEIDAIQALCQRFHLSLIEDAAESLGSLYKNQHTGTFGLCSTLSFNGNKIITTGGGGMILTAHPDIAQTAKHITTTAKRPHPFEYVHDTIGFNYRMPNLNAALGCAQLEQLSLFIEKKRQLASLYQAVLKNSPLQFIAEPPHCRSNYWLNAVLCENKTMRDALLEKTNASGIMTRPAWHPMHQLPLFKNAPSEPLPVTEWVAERLVNLPSTVALEAHADA